MHGARGTLACSTTVARMSRSNPLTPRLRRLGWATADSAMRCPWHAMPARPPGARSTSGNGRPCLRAVGHVVVCVVRHANAARQDRNNPCGRTRHTACGAMPCNPRTYSARSAIQRSAPTQTRCARIHHSICESSEAEARCAARVSQEARLSHTARWWYGRGGPPERPQPSAIIHAM